MQIEQRVHLDGGLAGAKSGPGKQREAEIDGGRVERVEAGIEINAEGVADIERPRDADQVLGEVGEDAPVVGLVGVGQGGARDAAAKAEMIAFGPQRAETGFDVTQTLAIGQLGERHGQKLLPAGQSTQAGIASIPLHAAAKLAVGQTGNQLRKDGASLVHAPSSTLREQPPKLANPFQIAARKNRP